MRREGRQHGMVRTYLILPSPYNPEPNTRIRNRIDSPPTAGLFTKVPTRPTNHSKFTGKCSRARCSECHLHPACKSKDKTKGNNKNKLFDASEHRMVVDGRPGLGLSGISASGLLGNLADYGYDDDVDEDLICRGLVSAADDNENKGPNPADQDEGLLGNLTDYGYDDDVNEDLICRGLVPAADDNENKGPNRADQDDYDHNGGDMNFYDVGLVHDHIEDGDWCLVEDW